jgi:VacB/RNase II family 3'-5' exoribonuclease
MNQDNYNSITRSVLQKIAWQAMLEKGLIPDFPPEVIAEADNLKEAFIDNEPFIDLRNLLWSSIDNDDSRDLDQLTVAQTLPGNKVKILVAIADVDQLVKKDSKIDRHARQNTTSVYTPAKIFPMLPEKLSTNITSLNYLENRLAIIIEILVNQAGIIENSDIYRGKVKNYAKLAYSNVAAWLDGETGVPLKISSVKGLAENLKIQFEIAGKLRAQRQQRGALNFNTVKANPVFDGDQVAELKIDKSNSSKNLIEEFMIAANGVSARFLSAKNFPSFRRVVRTPKRWNRIVEIAAGYEFVLPEQPDPKALEQFLNLAGKKDPEHFPDLSLSIIKLLGPGEYTVETPGSVSTGHFGLAVRDYSHSTAPNRRYPDLITHRLIKSALTESAVPYRFEELLDLAAHCTEMENAARKVERRVAKSAFAAVLKPRIGEEFDALITGASEKGSWVRLFNPPIEGKLVRNPDKLDVGQKVRVKLVQTEIEPGFIDFKLVKN